MADRTKLERLIASVLEEAERLGYSEATITGFRRSFRAFAGYASERGEGDFTEGLAVSFLNERFGAGIGHLYQGNPRERRMKPWLRAMRMLLEYQACGIICKRMPGELKRTPLPHGLQALLDSFDAASRRAGHSESTIYSRSGRIKNFLLYMAQRGGTDASCLDESSAHDYILTKASNHAKTVGTILTAIRCFYRHLFLAGLVGRDLTGTVPRPKLRYEPELPRSWSREDVEALMGAIDRGNPTGKRDYAMLLMVARLGLRASDIKALRIADLDWGGRTVSIVQHKTGVPLELPLLDDVGWAVIEYLRDGRPEGATCPELFVRHVAPFDPFGATSNLTNVLVRHARAAGLSPQRGRTPRSLRHALAKRLLEQEVPIEDISRILGHVSKRATSIYLRMDIEMLSRCPLDPEEVAP